MLGSAQNHSNKVSYNMKTFLSALLILSVACVGLAIQANDFRALFGHWFSGGGNHNNGGLFSPCNGCPLRNCLNDRAVILGYCCGCARVSDFLPIDCPALRISCPADGRRLCRDYDYMLNCCCP